MMIIISEGNIDDGNDGDSGDAATSYNSFEIQAHMFQSGPKLSV